MENKPPSSTLKNKKGVRIFGRLLKDFKMFLKRSKIFK